MKFLAKIFLFALAIPLVAFGSPRLLRFMSYTIRDAPPSIEEAQDYSSGAVILEQLIDGWFETEAHEQRVQRLLEDFFGVDINILGQGAGGELQQNDSGAYFLTDDCGDQGIHVEAWWIERGDTILACPDIVNANFWRGPTAARHWQACNTSIAADNCGCGPKMIFCIPRDEFDRNTLVATEWRRRALYAYQQGLSWSELFAGRWIYGNRLLAHLYFMADFLNRNEPAVIEKPDMTYAIEQIQSLPFDEDLRIDLSGPLRKQYGIATSIGLFVDHKTYRSRVKELTQKLLCHDIDSSLNTDLIETLVNPSVSRSDRAHVEEDACASCHNVLDNMATVFSNYTDIFYGAHPLTDRASELGHVFGEDGEGPGFLLSKLMAHPDFHYCMARRVWEDVSGVSWDELALERRNNFAAQSRNGPRDLIRYIMMSQELRMLRR